MRKLLVLPLICVLSMGLTPQQKIILSSIPNWVPNPQNPPDIAINWQQNIAWRKKGGYISLSALGVTITRASAETNLLSTSPSGFAYTSVPSGVIASGPAFGGRQTWESRTNFLLNSAAPVTQTTGSLANGTYTLWVNGSGTATMSAGTATGCGTSAASQGTPISFTTSGAAGTCTVTVGGSLNFFQLELNPASVSAPSPGIVTAGATVTRAADVVSMSATFGGSLSIFSQIIPQTGITFGSNQFTSCPSDGTTTNRGNVFRTASTGVGSFSGTGNVTAVSNYWNGSNSGSVVLSQNSISNGAASFTTSGSLTKINFGGRSDGGFLEDGITTVDAIWLTQALPASQLQSMQ